MSEELFRPIFEETIRFETPVQQFFRTASRDAEIGGTGISKDERVMIFLGAANRDPRRWEDPDRFDITRRVRRIELAGEPQRHLNNTIRSFESLPVTFHAP